MKKIKVLQIIDGKQYAGIYEIMVRIGNNIKNIEFNYLSPTKVYESDKSFDLNIDRKKISGRIVYNFRLYKFLKKHTYEIAHISSGAFFFTFFCVIACRLSGVNRVVVHSRNTPNINFFKKFLIRLLNPLYRKLTCAHLACSKKAIKSLFTKSDDVIVLKNGIDVNKYKYNEKIRKEIRKELNIEDKIVYGHVGRFDKQKNHEFLIDLFYELQKQQDCVLLLIGTGDLESSIKKKVSELGISDKVLFLDFRDDVNKLLNCMDVFLFPSLYEGFGNVVIEALTNGLPIFVSSGVPDDSNVSNNFHKINTYNIDDWVSDILSVDFYDRKSAYKDIIKAGFDIKDTSKELEKIYIDLMKK